MRLGEQRWPARPQIALSIFSPYAYGSLGYTVRPIADRPGSSGLSLQGGVGLNLRLAENVDLDLRGGVIQHLATEDPSDARLGLSTSLGLSFHL